ncbi:GLPGLI family protein [Pedobacter sp. Leaf170]|uniref:GLPGLI family protein n=1 Tax=Pedobacter sp. Leaf170 TaxID=2876558 RepID=UPI001E2D40A1|nr:GLPGLI family protein [Pedobacter sp. Leaf170]
MIKSIVYVFFLFTPIISNAQSGILNYSYTINYDSLTINKLQLRVLFNKNKSLEEILPLVKHNTELKQIDDSHSQINITVPDKGKRPFLYKNFSQKRLILSDQFFIKKYLIEDTLNNFNWKITNEKKMILKYNCTKAITNFRGRNYIAWFADEIPISNGPWKFCGLPGLIICVYDDRLIYHYELTGIVLGTEINDERLTLTSYFNETSNKLISHKEYIDAYERTKKHLIKYSRSQTTNNSTSKIEMSEQKEKF